MLFVGRERPYVCRSTPVFQCALEATDAAERRRSSIYSCATSWMGSPVQCAHTHCLAEPSDPGRIKITSLRKVWSLLPGARVGAEGVAAALGGKGEASLGLSLSGVCLLKPSRLFSFCR